MRAAFARFDANRSGKLDHRELRAALRQLGLDVGEGEATVILQRHDANNNGLLDVREFGSLVRQLGRRGTVDLVTHAAGAVWQTAQSDDGRQYFFNDVTGESTWRRPAALDAKPRPAARATPRRTADEPPLSPATVPRASRTRLAPPQPLPCTRAAHACDAPHATRSMPRAPCHAPQGPRAMCTVRHALQHTTHSPRCSTTPYRCSLPSTRCRRSAGSAPSPSVASIWTWRARIARRGPGAAGAAGHGGRGALSIRKSFLPSSCHCPWPLQSRLCVIFRSCETLGDHYGALYTHNAHTPASRAALRGSGGRAARTARAHRGAWRRVCSVGGGGALSRPLSLAQAEGPPQSTAPHGHAARRSRASASACGSASPSSAQASAPPPPTATRSRTRLPGAGPPAPSQGQPPAAHRAPASPGSRVPGCAETAREGEHAGTTLPLLLHCIIYTRTPGYTSSSSSLPSRFALR